MRGRPAYGSDNRAARRKSVSHRLGDFTVFPGKLSYAVISKIGRQGESPEDRRTGSHCCSLDRIRLLSCHEFIFALGIFISPRIRHGSLCRQSLGLPLALSNTAAFLVFVVAASKSKAKHPPLAGAIGFVACGLIFLLGFLGSGNLPLLFLSGGCVGIGTTCCFICWETVLSRMDDHQRKPCILAGSTLSAASFAFFATADNSLTLFAIMLLAFGNIAMMHLCLRALPEKQEEHPFTLDAKSLKEYAGFLLCILAIGIISPVIDGTIPSESNDLIGRGFIVHGANVLSAVILGIAWFAFNKTITIKRAYYLVFPLFVTALFLFPFVSDEMKQAASFAASFGFTLFSIVMMISCIEISEENTEGLSACMHCSLS